MPAYKTVILVGDVEDKLALGFTTIEVWASFDEGGTYREATAPAGTPATYYSAPFPPAIDVSGYSFEFSIDGYESRRVTFPSSVASWSLPMIASKINEVFPGSASVNTIGRSQYVAISSQFAARSSSVECTYSENPLVFPLGKSLGKASRPLLQAGKYIYEFSDPEGKDDTRYKWRFSHNGSGPISDFSFRVLGKLDRAPAVAVSIATARFVGMDGQPSRRSVIICNGSLQTSAGKLVDTFSEAMVVASDDSGFLQAALPQGLKVKVAIEGTAFVREFTVPSTPTFDLLQAMALAPDQFTVQTTAPLLTRRSL